MTGMDNSVGGVTAAAAGGLVVGDRRPGNGQRTAGRIDASPAGAVTVRQPNRGVAAPRPVVLEDHVVQRHVAAVVEDPATQGIRRPGQRTVRFIVLGQAALDDQVLEDDLGARVDDLKDPVLELTGVNDRRVVARRAGALDDPAVAGLVQVQVAGEARRLVTVANVLDGQSVRARP
jgi:hypothetical protein